MTETQNETTPAPVAGSGKNFEVIVTAYSTVIVVNAKDESEAMELAMDAVSTGDFDVEDARVEREIKDPSQLERAKKHANCVADDDE